MTQPHQNTNIESQPPTAKQLKPFGRQYRLAKDAHVGGSGKELFATHG